MASVLQSDRVQVNNRWLHCDGGNAGLLKTDGNWDMYMNNSGQMWTANYGWLHDYFISSVQNCARGGSNSAGNTGNCNNAPNCYTVVSNCGNVAQAVVALEDGGSYARVNGYQYNFNCNCNCVCDCRC